MGSGEEKLTVSAEAKGFEDAAKKIDKVSGAEEKLVEKTEGSAKAKGKAEEAQKKLSAAESDYIGILTQIHPALGQLVDGMLKGGKVAGDLASANIDLRGTLAKATAAIKANAGALKLIGAGGAVVLAIYAITRAMAAMRAEAKQVAKAIRDTNDALDEFEEKRMARMGATEKASAGRAEGPLSASESTAMDSVIRRMGQRLPSVADDEPRRQAALLLGVEASSDRLDRTAIMLDRFAQDSGVNFDSAKTMEPEARGEYIDRRLSAFEDRITTILETERVQAGELIHKAIEEMETHGGSTFAIRKFLESLPGRDVKGVEPERLAKVVSGLYDVQDRELGGVSVTRALLHLEEFLDKRVLGQSGEHVNLKHKAALLEREGLKEVTPALVRAAEMAMQQLLKAAEKLEEAARLNGAAAEANREAARSPTVVNNHMQHARFVSPRRGLVRNGESERQRTGQG